MVDAGHGKTNSALQQRINSLIEEKHKREKELEEKLLELKEKKKIDEESAKAEIERTLREIQNEEEEKFRQEQQLTKKNIDNQTKPLENFVDEEAKKFSPQPFKGFYSPGGMGIEGEIGITDFTNPDVYNKVKELVNTPLQYRTNEEQNFLKGVTYHVNRIQIQEARNMTQKDPDDYIARTQNLISSFYK